jgi:hypothetical protein
MNKTLKNAQVIVEDEYGVCLWKMQDGSVLGDDDGRFLSLNGKLNDPLTEAKMLKAARYWIGVEADLGGPLWIPGSRKISDEEYDDQSERLRDGEIPDVVDQVKQLERRTA